MASADEGEGWFGALWKGAVGAAGAALFLWLMGLLSPLWSWVQSASASLWTHLMAQSSWPNWLAYAMSLLAAVACLRWAARHWRNRKDSTWRFHQLDFRGVIWRWPPTSGLPGHVVGYCQVCDMQLVRSYTPPDRYEGRAGQIALYCERCNVDRFRMDGDSTYLQERIIREIDRLQRTGEWKAHVPD